MTDTISTSPAPALEPVAEPEQLQQLRGWLAKLPSARLRTADVRWVVDQLAERLAPATPAAPTAEDLDAYTARVRAEIDRQGGDLTAVVGVVVGAASACWSNLDRAGVFQDGYAAVLVDVLAERIAAARCACNTTEQRTHPAGDPAFCTARPTPPALTTSTSPTNGS